MFYYERDVCRKVRGIIAVSDSDAGIIAELTSSEALALASAGTLSDELVRHLRAAAYGVRAGIEAAQLLDLSSHHAAIVEMLTAQHVGTRVVSNIVLSRPRGA